MLTRWLRRRTSAPELRVVGMRYRTATAGLMCAGYNPLLKI
ncbi:MAG: hypothetical protein NZM11_07960 [Anaerolineales bacterium]|nr:hypothetical protein [Anaerolineales bacterium]